MGLAVALRIRGRARRTVRRPGVDCRRSSMRVSTRLRTLAAALSALAALLTTAAAALAGGGNPPFPK
jgi:hypothetical protein